MKTNQFISPKNLFGAGVLQIVLLLSIGHTALAQQPEAVNEWFQISAAPAGLLERDALAFQCLDVEAASDEVGANVVQGTCAGPPVTSQLWRFDPVDVDGETWLQISAYHSGLCLEVSPASQEDGANVVQWTCDGFEAQLWSLQNGDLGYSRIVAKHSGKCLWLETSSPQAGAGVQQRECSEEDDEQVWIITPTPFRPDLRPVRPDGWPSPIVASTQAGDHVDSPRLTPYHEVHLDLAAGNRGYSAASAFEILVLVDDEEMWRSEVTGLEPGEDFIVEDLNIGPLAAGPHTLQLRVDPDDRVVESDNFAAWNNNFYAYIFVGDPEMRVIPRFVVTWGLTSELVVTNLSLTDSVRGSVRFFDPDGEEIDATLLLPTGSEFHMGPQGTQTLTLNSGQVLGGSAHVASSGPVSAMIRVRSPDNTLGGIPSAGPLGQAIVPILQQGSRSPGVAAVNTSSSAITLALTLQDEEGLPVAEEQRTLEVNASFGETLNQLFPELGDFDFAGTLTLKAESTTATFAAVVLESGEAGNLTPMPVDPADRSVQHRVRPVDIEFVNSSSSDPRGGNLLQVPSGWPLGLRLSANNELGMATDHFNFPPPGVKGFLVFEDPDGCLSITSLAAALSPQGAPLCPVLDETFLEFTPDRDMAGMEDQSGNAQMREALVGDSPTILAWGESAYDREKMYGPGTGGDVSDGYGAGADDDVPGLVLLADRGFGVELDEGCDPADPDCGRTGFARNLAGFFDSVAYELNDATRRTNITLHMNVPSRLFEPLQLIDTCVGTPEDCELSPLVRIDGADAMSVAALTEQSGLSYQEMLQDLTITLRAFVVKGIAPARLSDMDGDGVIGAGDAEFEGYTLLSGEAFLEFRIIYNEFGPGFGNSAITPGNFYWVDLDGNGGEPVLTIPGGPGRITRIPR